MENKTVDCPFCPCTFFHQSDLKRHMQTYSYYEQAHRTNWRRENERREKYG